MIPLLSTLVIVTRILIVMQTALPICGPGTFFIPRRLPMGL